MIDLATQHELDVLQRDNKSLLRYKNLYKELVKEYKKTEQENRRLTREVTNLERKVNKYIHDM